MQLRLRFPKTKGLYGIWSCCHNHTCEHLHWIPYNSFTVIKSRSGNLTVWVVLHGIFTFGHNRNRDRGREQMCCMKRCGSFHTASKTRLRLRPIFSKAVSVSFAHVIGMGIVTFLSFTIARKVTIVTFLPVMNDKKVTIVTFLPVMNDKKVTIVTFCDLFTSYKWYCERQKGSQFYERQNLLVQWEFLLGLEEILGK